jgi:hypothetical protein
VRYRNVVSSWEGSFVQLPSKKLRQQRAALGARQGDPETPASGTLYARRRRLAQELETIVAEQGADGDSTSRGPSIGATMLRLQRSSAEVQRDLEVLDAEIEDLQQQIDAIDLQLTRTERKG